MKYIKLTFGLLFLAFAFTLTAQDLPSIDETTKTMSNGSKNSFSIEYVGVRENIVEDEWRDIMKGKKAKPKKNKAKEWLSDDATVRGLSDNTVDVYATTSYDKAADKTYFTVWFDLGGAYLSSAAHPDQSVEVQNMLNTLSRNVMRTVAEENVEAQEKTLKGLVGDLEKLGKQKADYEKEIEKAKETIAKMEANIETNVKDQGTKDAEIKAQEKVVEEAKKEMSKY